MSALSFIVMSSHLYFALYVSYNIAFDPIANCRTGMPFIFTEKVVKI